VTELVFLVPHEVTQLSEVIMRAKPRRVPMAVKLAFTAFMAVLVPVFWHYYGPAVFFYFCCIALFLVLGGLWFESALLVGTAAVCALIGQLLWTIDFLTGGHLMTGYMFDPRYPLIARGLTLFHVWLPAFLLWLIGLVGYDRRSMLAMTLLGWALLVVSFFWLPRPSDFGENSLWSTNINYVFGLDGNAGPPFGLTKYQWFAMMLVMFPVCFFLPAHLLLLWFFRPPKPYPEDSVHELASADVSVAVPSPDRR
jgi:hypothetical protein